VDTKARSLENAEELPQPLHLTNEAMMLDK
jgi:hypothetical protein